MSPEERHEIIDDTIRQFGTFYQFLEAMASDFEWDAARVDKQYDAMSISTLQNLASDVRKFRKECLKYVCGD